MGLSTLSTFDQAKKACHGQTLVSSSYTYISVFSESYSHILISLMKLLDINTPAYISDERKSGFNFENRKREWTTLEF